MNVLELIKAHIPRDRILKVSKFLGESELATAQGFEYAVPAILAGILNSTDNKQKIINIWDLIQHKENDPELLNQLDALFEGNTKDSSNTSIGADLLNLLFGGKHAILDNITILAGFQNNSSAGKVLSITAPLVMAFLHNKSQIASLGMAGLLKWLLDNKNNVLEALPVGWTSQMGMTHLMFKNEKNMEMDSERNTTNNRYWGFWLIALIALIAGLWFCVKSCNQTEMVDRFTGAIKNATAVIDSASDKASQSAKETLDSAAQVFKSKWTELGNYINIRLGEFTLSLPSKGVEIKLVEWLQNKANEVDKATWFNFDRILFETGSASLNKVSDEQMTNIATIMKAMPSLEFKIGGYTDNTGDPAANMKLSLERAEAVKNALVDLGIDAKRLDAEGYGPEHPFADNATEEGREQNRRVAIRVTKK